MTLEVYNGSPMDRRFARQLGIQWACLWQLARNRRRVLRAWHDASVTAVEPGQGREARAEQAVLPPRPEGADPGADRAAAPLLRTRHAAHPRRGVDPDPPTAAHGRRRLPPRRGHAPARLPRAGGADHRELRACGRHGRPGRHGVDPDGAASEALDPGRDGRTALLPHVLHVRALGMELPAEHEPQGRIHEREGDLQRDSIAAGTRARPPGDPA